MLCERIQVMFRILSAFRRLNSFQIIVLGFAFVILLGAGILMLPVSSADGSWTPFVNALFTSVTSVCVTGLVVCDTGTYWSSFGHAVILLLIQTGGLGVVTISASFTILSGKKIGLSQRSIMAESVAAPQLSGIVRLTGFIVRVTLGVELIGALHFDLVCDSHHASGVATSSRKTVVIKASSKVSLIGSSSSAVNMSVLILSYLVL